MQGGRLEISAEDMIYVDPSLTSPIQGLKEYEAHLKGSRKVQLQGFEFIDPRIVVVGDAAVLSYNYRTSSDLPEGGSGETLWNVTEVYFRDATSGKSFSSMGHTSTTVASRRRSFHPNAVSAPELRGRLRRSDGARSGSDGTLAQR